MRLAGKTAISSDATGMGGAASKLFAADGAKVAISIGPSESL
jgi:NAD(P)-dependent dehydrogenase (short-subunit alcohol dehydrogenase family)